MCKDNVRELSINVVLSACDRYLKSEDEKERQYQEEYNRLLDTFLNDGWNFWIGIKTRYDADRYLYKLRSKCDPRTAKLIELDENRDWGRCKGIVRGVKKLCEVQDINSTTIIITNDTALILKDFL